MAHDPARFEEARAMRAKGGVATGISRRKARAANPLFVPKAPQNLEDAARFASWLTHAVTVGTLDARTGHEAAYALRAFQSMVEKRDLLREVESLRAELADARKARPGSTVV